MSSLIYLVLTTATLVVTSLFILVFSREPWWRQPFGRSVMIMAAAIWLLAVSGTLRQWLGPDYPGRDVVRILGQAGVVFAMGQRLVVLLRARHHDHSTQQ